MSKRKTNIQARVEKIGESVTKLTKFGWMVMSPGREDHSNVYLTESTTRDYEFLYRLDILGLDSTSTGDQYTVYTKFKEKLQRSPQDSCQDVD